MGVESDTTGDGRGLVSSSDTGSYDGQDDLAIHLSELARDLQEEPTVQSTLDGIVAAAVQHVPGSRPSARCRTGSDLGRSGPRRIGAPTPAPAGAVHP